MIRRMAYVTAAAARGRDPDEPLLLAALGELGVDVEVCDWDDPAVAWESFDRAVLRSAWDYPERLGEFLAWVDRTAGRTELVNPPLTVRWNVDKHYLAALAAGGVRITPTTFLEPGDDVVIPPTSSGIVVKPAVGAGSRDAARYEPTDEHVALADAHARRLLAEGRSVLVQPYLASIGREGEWPHVFLDGAFSHVAHKRVELPLAGLVDGLFALEDNRPAPARAELVAEATRAVEVVSAAVGVPRYARVDMVVDDDDAACVLEVELIEPSLFLPENPDAVFRTARALAAR